MEDKEKIENKVDLKKKKEKSVNRKIIISQVIIILIFIAEVAVIVDYIYDKINNPYNPPNIYHILYNTNKSNRWCHTER